MSKNGLILLKPTSVDKTGGGSETASISANGSVEFALCETLSLNGVFSADYDNYQVVMRMNSSAGVSVLYRLRSGGVDESSASNYYTTQQLNAEGTTVSGTRATWDKNYFGSANTTAANGSVMSIYGPYLAQPTASRVVNVDAYLNARILDFAGTHSLSTSYDGLTFVLGSAQTISGRVAVYGMRK